MQPTMEVLERIRKNSATNKEEVFTRLFRYLLRPDIYFEAYKHLYANDGAATRGVNGDTVDGFSEEKISKIIRSLSEDTFEPSPVRRTYIEKRNGSGKKRPLGLPTFTDKLVQEALRMVLESVYEPIFLDCSHGFRPDRSCHTALKSLKREFNGAKWFVEGDIKGCFDNIDHTALVGFIREKVKDAQIIKLIYKFLKAGYLENWQYHKTYSGTPQGGIISPLLANIYLHELDKFVMKLKVEFEKPRDRHYTPEYQGIHYEMRRLKIRIEKCDSENRQALIEEYQKKRAELLQTPCKSQTDKILKYVRYADDFLIAIKGSREECEEIKRRLTEFIGQSLNMELSAEKTLITHSNNFARFLGYDVRIRRDNQTVKHGGAGNRTQRTLNNMTELTIPLEDKIHKFLFSKSIVEQKGDGTLFPIHRSYLVNLTELEIVSTYNAELRGICNFYRLACNFSKLNYFAYLMEYSCLKTLAAKHKSTIRKIRAKYSDGKNGWGIPYETKKGSKICGFAKYADCKKDERESDMITNAAVMYGYSRNSFEMRLKAKTCELCGTTEKVELHHVNKVKNLSNKKAWERAMIAKRRKTLAVCAKCHDEIHRN